MVSEYVVNSRGYIFSPDALKSTGTKWFWDSVLLGMRPTERSDAMLVMDVGGYVVIHSGESEYRLVAATLPMCVIGMFYVGGAEC